MPSKKKHPVLGRASYDVYRDPRTGTPVAVGARQNWPSKNDLKYMEHEYRTWRALAKVSSDNAKVGSSAKSVSSIA